MTSPYDTPSDPAKRQSAALTDGPDRAGARAMLKGTGFTDEDLAKPIVGVGTTWIETMPCNLNQRDLAVHVKRGVRDAGGTPMEFNTIAVSDGVSMGTSGMRASLISREVIADSIELVARGHLFDGLVMLVACDKTNPARGDGRRAPRHPRDRLVHRLDRAGRLPAARGLGRRRLRGNRRARGREADRCRPPRARVRRLSRRRRVRRPVHGQHDVDDPRLPRALAVRHERDPGDASRQGGGGLRARTARGRRRAPERDAAVVRDDGVVRERRGLGRGDGRLDERRPPPRRDRARLRDRVHDRRLRADLGANADRGRHEAVGALARERHVCGGRSRTRRPRAPEGRPAPRGRVGRSTGRRSASTRPPQSRRRASRSSSRSRRRSRRAAASRCCTATSRPRGARSSSPATIARSIAGPRASSTPRRSASLRSRPGRSSRGTSS